MRPVSDAFDMAGLHRVEPDVFDVASIIIVIPNGAWGSSPRRSPGKDCHWQSLKYPVHSQNRFCHTPRTLAMRRLRLKPLLMRRQRVE